MNTDLLQWMALVGIQLQFIGIFFWQYFHKKDGHK